MMPESTPSPYLIIKRWQLILAFVGILFSTGIQVGLGIARSDFDKRISVLEDQKLQSEAIWKELTSLTVETARLRIEVEGLRRDLDKARR